MMIDQILERLNKVHKHGSGYMACCPAHEDKNPSLRVTERDDKILIKCFSGCETRDIVSAIGLELKDLFADSGWSISEKVHYKKEMRKQAFSKILDYEMLVIKIARNQIARGETLTDTDQTRLELAVRRAKAINDGVRL